MQERWVQLDITRVDLSLLPNVHIDKTHVVAASKLGVDIFRSSLVSVVFILCLTTVFFSSCILIRWSLQSDLEPILLEEQLKISFRGVKRCNDSNHNSCSHRHCRDNHNIHNSNTNVGTGNINDSINSISI